MGVIVLNNKLENLKLEKFKDKVCKVLADSLSELQGPPGHNLLFTHRFCDDMTPTELDSEQILVLITKLSS